MPGRGPAPKPHRQRARDEKRRARSWETLGATGWQHGPVPKPPAGLLPEAVEAWRTWFGAWFAAHWTPGDLPGLGVTVGLYDQVRRGDWVRAGEFRLWADSYGITPKGAQALRWAPPKAAEAAQDAPGRTSDPYAHLRVIGDEPDDDAGRFEP